MAPFVYNALRENEIRPVDIFPAGGNEEQIEIGLSTANLSRCPDYRLLTYTWGNPEERRIVKCNGHEIQVLQTVHSALLALRENQSLSTPLWISTLYISQEDNSEKGEIMGQMTHILGKAFHTILWVGPASVHTSAAFEVVSKLISARRGVLQDVPLSEIGPQALQTAREKYREIVSLSPPAEWKALEDITGRRMFTRLILMLESP
jgi:hypothetical protein